MSWIIEKQRRIFFHNPRTAGTSMVKALVDGLGAYHYSHDCTLEWRKDHCVDVPPGMEDYQRIAFVRNPYQRELSFYFWHRTIARDAIQKAARLMTFKGYMRWRIDHVPESHLRLTHGTQSRYLLGTGATIQRHEDLPGSFGDLFGAPLPRVPETVSPAYRLGEHYDEETRELVRLYAGADFLNYGYSP